MPTPSKPSILAKIVDRTRADLDIKMQERSEMDLLRDAQTCVRTQRLAHQIRLGSGPRIIAEFKRASPSKGQIADSSLEPVKVAVAYERAGAAAISVLCEPHFFQGSLDDLAAIRKKVSIPLLRKDFIIHNWQIVESRVYGADAILLIAAILDDKELSDLADCARNMQLDTLIEVHNERELDRVLRVNPSVIGVNNRNLETFDVSLDTSKRLAPKLRKVISISESGIKSRTDINELEDCGYHGFLIGETFMKTANPGKALAQIRNQISDSNSKKATTPKG